MSNLNSKKAIKERLNPKIRHGRHCTFLIHAHLVFVTKYRRVCFTPRVLDHLKEVFDSVCNDFEAELVEFQGEGDHVHLLVNYPPKVALSRFVGSLKGVSSRYIRESNCFYLTFKGDLRHSVNSAGAPNEPSNYRRSA